MENTAEAGAKTATTKKAKAEGELPVNLGKAWNDCEVPDFNDPNRPKTCLEVDFPIAQINALSQLEGNAGKPIYQMSKWWARRRSSVFRSMLLPPPPSVRTILPRQQKPFGSIITAITRKLGSFPISKSWSLSWAAGQLWSRARGLACR